MKVYVASSWRNVIQPAVVKALREAGHEVYDFRHPEPGDDGFHWSSVDPAWKDWSLKPAAYLKGLEHPNAVAGFAKDMRGLNGADATVLVLPCGRSAHLEAGYAAGQGKPVIILLDPTFEPELMYKLAYRCVTTIEQIIIALAEIGIDRGAAPVAKAPAAGNPVPDYICAMDTCKLFGFSGACGRSLHMVANLTYPPSDPPPGAVPCPYAVFGTVPKAPGPEGQS